MAETTNAPMDGGDEEGIRLARRRTLDGEVVLCCPDGHGEVALRCRDVSVSGLFVYSWACAQPGNEFVCRLTMSDGEVVEALGRVSRVVLDEEQPSQSGMGIRFTRLAREARERLVAFTTPPRANLVLAALG